MHQTLGRSMSFNVEQMTALFTRSDGTYLCARWGRPIAAVIFVIGQYLGTVRLPNHAVDNFTAQFSN